MKEKEDLINFFSTFPGIGKKQAERFTYFLAYKDKNFIENFINTISSFSEKKSLCLSCNRFFLSQNKNCHICLDSKRENGKILILEKNADFENIEKVKLWSGKYFLIGKNLKLTEKKSEEKLNLKSLFKKIESGKIFEITIALPLTPEGEFTKDAIKEILFPYRENFGFDIKELARGISLGAEIEYSDKETLKEAFKNRK